MADIIKMSKYLISKELFVWVKHKNMKALQSVWSELYWRIQAPGAVAGSALSHTKGRLLLSGGALMAIWKVSQGVQKSNLIINKSLQENQRK